MPLLDEPLPGSTLPGAVPPPPAPPPAAPPHAGLLGGESKGFGFSGFSPSGLRPATEAYRPLSKPGPAAGPSASNPAQDAARLQYLRDTGADDLEISGRPTPLQAENHPLYPHQTAGAPIVPAAAKAVGNELGAAASKSYGYVTGREPFTPGGNDYNEVAQALQTPLTKYVGAGDPRLTVGPLSVGTSPLDIATLGVPALKGFGAAGNLGGRMLAGRAGMAGAAEGAGGLAGPGMTRSVLPSTTTGMKPPVPSFANAPKFTPAELAEINAGRAATARPAPAAPPTAAPAPPAPASPAAAAPAARAGWQETLAPLVPSGGRTALEMASGTAPFTNAMRVPVHAGRAAANVLSGNFGAGLGELGRGTMAAGRAAVGSAPLMVASEAVPAALGESEHARRVRLQNPTESGLSLSPTETQQRTEGGETLLHKAMLPFTGLYRQLAVDPADRTGPSAVSAVKNYWGNLGNLAGFGASNPHRLADYAERQYDALSGHTAEYDRLGSAYRDLNTRFADAAKADPANRPALEAQFANDAKALEGQFRGVNKLTSNVTGVGQRLDANEAAQRLRGEMVPGIPRAAPLAALGGGLGAGGLAAAEPQKFNTSENVLPAVEEAYNPEADRLNPSGVPNRYAPRLGPDGRPPADYPIPFSTGADEREGRLRAGIPFEGHEPTKLDPSGAQAREDRVREMMGGMRGMAARVAPPAPQTPPVAPPGGSMRGGPGGIASTGPGSANFDYGLGAADNPVKTSPGLTMYGAGGSGTTGGAVPQGGAAPYQWAQNAPPEAVKENLTGIISASGGIGGALAAASTSPPPEGFEKYWGGLDSTSKFLAIGGLSVAAITALRSLFSSGHDEDEEGFLMKILPLLGVGAAAWGAGGGSLSKLPTMENYKNLGGAITSNVGSLFGK